MLGLLTRDQEARSWLAGPWRDKSLRGRTVAAGSVSETRGQTHHCRLKALLCDAGLIWGSAVWEGALGGGTRQTDIRSTPKVPTGNSDPRNGASGKMRWWEMDRVGGQK